MWDSQVSSQDDETMIHCDFVEQNDENEKRDSCCVEFGVLYELSYVTEYYS